MQASAEQPWIVLKFGGTSVSSLARWQTIAGIVREHLDRGHRPFLVCSAVAGVSNILDKLLGDAVRGAHEPILEQLRQRHVDLANGLDVDPALVNGYLDELSRLALGASLIREANPRLQARVMAMGELMATALGAAYLQREGLDTRLLDARAFLTSTGNPDLPDSRRYLAAVCGFEPDAALQRQLADDGASVVLTQGFIASTPQGDTVLLGRGGSDTSAACFAAKLQADRLEIWTDVPGMFTANPRQIPSARLLRQLGYDEAQELATMGGKVLHPRCLEPVRRYSVPLYIRSTEDPALEGTVISNEAPDFGAKVKAISSKAGIILISMDTLGMWEEVGFLSDVFSTFKRHGLSVDLIATSETNVTVSLDVAANALDPARIRALVSDLNTYCTAREIGPCAVVSLVGRNIRSILHELGPAFEVFEEQHIFLVSQAASDLNISFVVDEEQAERLMRSLHAQLFAFQQTDELFGPSWQAIQGEQPAVAGAGLWWRSRRDDLLQLAEHESPVYVYDEDVLRANAEAALSIKAMDRVFYAMKANSNADVLRLVYEAGLGFECVSPGEVGLVRSLFPDIARDRILYTPNFAPSEEYTFGFQNAGHVTLDNVYPLEAWPEVFQNREVIIRIDPGRGHGHHKHVRTAGTQSKFGVSPGELQRLQTLAEQAGARIVGLHAHVGSGIVTPETWSETALFLATLADRFPDVRLLNVGGGLGVAERPGALALDVKAVAQSLARVKKAHPKYELWMEPGRFLVAQAGVLLAKVTQLKQKGAVHYVGLETGMNSLIRPALYGAYHEIVNLTRLDEHATVTAEVVGPICETGDVLGHGRRLPESREGDVFLIATAGAYGYVMSSNYNLRPPAKEVVLHSETVGV
ncbi:MAG TPA: bifunctional aspartate kinase/diaminopimelate decarboxylase [Rhodothermales bacterium]|nr:bifunctional aspartate kinase/diaminopimelate decarboxylase [Rhodothermales bacterium]